MALAKRRQRTILIILILFLLSVCSRLIIVFIFHFFILIGVLLRGMAESCLRYKDEVLIPNIDRVMAV